MAQPLRMHQIRKIIELSQQGRGIRQIQRLTGLARNTIREYLRRITRSGLSWDQLQALDEQNLAGLLSITVLQKATSGRPRSDRYETFKEQFAYFIAQLRQRGVTRQVLWEEYRKQQPDGYGYTQFCEHLSQLLKRQQAVMHFTHRPAEQLQVDFAGGQLNYIERATGEVVSCAVLVCALPYSHYLYVEALRSQQQEFFIDGLVRALEYLGGVPLSIKCDNLRSAVVRANRYEPQFTQAMEYLGIHYNTTIVTARVRKPRDKASVEKAVDLVYKHIYAPLRQQAFYSLEELNTAIRKQLEWFNARLLKGQAISRKTLFETDEQSLLLPLPASRYQIRHVTEGKVQRNYHVILGEDRHQYSVPYTLIGKRLRIIYTSQTVELYEGFRRVALHPRSYRKNGYTTLAEHMPPHHQHTYQQKGWDADYFQHQAAQVGTATSQIIQRVLASKVFYEQTYNSCLGILRLAKHYSPDRLEAACQRALVAPVVNYTLIANILKNSLDKVSALELHPQIPSEHEQIRGSQRYQ